MIIYDWTGIECKALRAAMLMSVEQFADALDIGQRTIEAWESQGAAAKLRPASKQVLEKALDTASDSVVVRFERALADRPGSHAQVDRSSPVKVTLANDTLGQRLPAALGVDAADEVWVPARTASGEVVLVSLPRRTVVTGLGVGALAAAVGLQPAAALANTQRFDHVEHFRKLRLSLIENDNLFGARGTIGLTEQSIDAMTRLRRAGIGDATGLQRMQILYAEGAAWLHQDCRNWDRAQYWTDRALEWSHRLGDPYYVAAALIRKAQIANDMGEGAEAVELAEAAERAAPPSTRFGAVAAAFAGWGSALDGNSANSGRSFERARVLADNAVDDSTWGLFLDDAYIDVHQAHSRVALGDYRGAVEQFESSLRLMQSGYTRDQAVYIARQAIAHAKAGEAEPAAALGTAAMRVGVGTGSERVLHTVRELSNHIDPSSKQPEIVEFRDQATQWAVLA